MFVDAEDRLFIVIESHCLRADSEMLKFRFYILGKHNLKWLFLAGLITEMKFREFTPSLGEGMETLLHDARHTSNRTRESPPQSAHRDAYRRAKPAVVSRPYRNRHLIEEDDAVPPR